MRPNSLATLRRAFNNLLGRFFFWEFLFIGQIWTLRLPIDRP